MEKIGKMKAAIFTKYGSPEVLKIVELDIPKPKDNEVLIKVYASSITVADVKTRSLPFPFLLRFLMRLILGFRKPKRPILGSDLAGEIEAVGRDVKLFKKGDQVFGSTSVYVRGCHSEYVSMPEEGILTIKPDDMAYEEAAAVFYGGNTALHYLSKVTIQKEQKVLIYGASGSVGTFAVQLVKHHFGAEVIGVCSTINLELVKSLGADKVIDYTKGDFTDNGDLYDLIFDAVGKIPKSNYKKMLNPNGIYLTVNKGVAREKNENLIFLKELIEEGKIKPIIDRKYSLEEIAEAHRYVDKGHKKGNVVITMH